MTDETFTHYSIMRVEAPIDMADYVVGRGACDDVEYGMMQVRGEMHEVELHREEVCELPREMTMAEYENWVSEHAEEALEDYL